MIEIDGSILEGGGQILRSAVSLSALTTIPVKITKIRAKRENPGLQAQHIASIEAVAELVDATVLGLQMGSSTIEFYPEKTRSGSFKINVGTAGSVTLVLQALTPVACFSPSEVTFELRGGTDVSWSPTFDYLDLVFVPTLKKMGCITSVQLIRRGHYPKGGGMVKAKVIPVSDKLNSINLNEFGEVATIKGVSHAVKLPEHVATRQAEAARDTLTKAGYNNIEIDIWYRESQIDHLGPGSGIALCALTTKGAMIGADALGEKGKPAEKVGFEAAGKLLTYLGRRCTVDRNLSDMLVPYMAAADGESRISTSELSLHTKTNIAITEKFLKAKFEVTEQNNLSIISCKGTGLSR
jgi:RNA 3'-terminal phosphate cyclase (ATP)